MNKLNIPTPSNGVKLYWDDFKFQIGLDNYDAGVIQAMQGILSVFGNNYIIEGCNINPPNCSAGWIFLNGEIVKVDAHAMSGSYFSVIQKIDATGQRENSIGGSVNIWGINRGVVTATAGVLPFNGIRLSNLIYRHSSTSILGMARLSSDTAANTGTNDNTIMTPLKVLSVMRTSANHAATEVNRGTVRKATPAERDAGTPNAFIDAELLAAYPETTTISVYENGTVFVSLTKLYGVVHVKVETTVNFNAYQGLRFGAAIPSEFWPVSSTERVVSSPVMLYEEETSANPFIAAVFFITTLGFIGGANQPCYIKAGEPISFFYMI